MVSIIISGPAPDIHFHFHDDNTDVVENGHVYSREKDIPDKTDTISDHKVIYPYPDFHPRYASTKRPLRFGWVEPYSVFK